MAVYTTNEIRSGMKVMIDGDPCVILDNVFVKPGKGQAFNRIKYRNLKSGRVVERTWKSGDSITAADVIDMEAQFLYSDGSHWHFMTKDSFEQYVMDEAHLGEAKQWIKDNSDCMLTLFNGQPLAVTAPNFVTLKIVETDPGVRGDTSGGGGKPAKLETGAVVRVPLFVQQDEIIKVDTRTGEYVSRVKE